MSHPRFLLLASALMLPASAAWAFDAASATNDFGLKIYRDWARQSPDSNLVISPYSIEYGMLLAYAGADGVTRSEIAQAMGLPDDDEELQREITRQRVLVDGAIQTAVFARKSPTEPQPELTVANHLFGQQGYSFRGAFLDALKSDYHAPFESVDFVGSPEKARATINDWVRGNTGGKIPAMVGPDAISPSTRLLLANAIYFKVPWKNKFKVGDTLPRAFRDFDRTSRDIPTMLQTAQLGYAVGRGYTAVAIPYLGGALECVIFLPDRDSSVERVADHLTAEILESAAKEDLVVENPQVKLYLPKFHIAAQTRSLGEELQALGMKSAFDVPAGSADFSRLAPIDPRARLAIGAVMHATYLDLDEGGTEAAAATAVQMTTFAVSIPALQPKVIEVRVDRPFLFEIRVKDTGLCLFLGRITDPQVL